MNRRLCDRTRAGEPPPPARPFTPRTAATCGPATSPCAGPTAAGPNRLIAWGTGSPYVHATMIGWCGDVLMLAEARQWRESHLVTLSSQVKQWPGLYDVYRVRRPFRPLAAWDTMVRATGTPYGWGQLLAAALRQAVRPAACPDPKTTRPTTIRGTVRRW